MTNVRQSYFGSILAHQMQNMAAYQNAEQQYPHLDNALSFSEIHVLDKYGNRKPGENISGANGPQVYTSADIENTNLNENPLGTVPQVSGSYDNDENMSPDENVPNPNKWGTENPLSAGSARRLDDKYEENIFLSNDANDVKNVNASSTFKRKLSSMKLKPKYPGAANSSIGSFGIGGLSGVTDPTNTANLSNITEMKPKPKYPETGGKDSDLTEGLSGLSAFGVSFASNNTLRCSSGLALKVKPLETPNQGQGVTITALTPDRQSEENEVTSLTNLSNVNGAASKDTFSVEDLSCVTDFTGTANLGPTQDRRGSNDSIDTFHAMGLSASTDITHPLYSKRDSLLRSKFFTNVPNIGEVNEDDVSSVYSSSIDAQESLRHLSFGSMKSDEIMSICSRSYSHLSKRGSTCIDLEDLSYLTGQMSICENVSQGYDEIEIAEWEREAIEWEKEAEMEDNEDMQEEMERVLFG